MTVGEIWRRILFVLRFDRRTRELEDEMRLHVELRAERMRHQGIASHEAERAAKRRFGNPGVLTELSRDVWGVELVDNVVRELRLAGRSLRHSTSFALTAALTLGIGIGALTCIFTVVNAVLLRPLPYAASDRIVMVQHALPGLKMDAVSRLTLGMYFTYGRLSTSLEGIAAYQTSSVNVGDERRDGIVERAQAGRINADLFGVLGVAPRLGRGFTELEDRPDGPAVVIVSEGMWRRALNADPEIIGRTIPIDGTPHRVVGVMPETFRFPESHTDVWLPLKADLLTSYSGGFDQSAVARLRPAVERGAAERELQQLVARVSERYALFAPGLPTAAMHAQAKPQVRLRPVRDIVVADVANVLWIVAGGVALVLLVACANVVNLLLVRIDARHRELALRRALGAGHVRLFGHVVAEIAILTAIGALLGFGGAVIGTRALTRIAPTDVPRLAEIRVDLSVLVFVVAVAAAVATVCTLIVAARHRVRELGTLLKDGARETAGRGRQQLRGALVVAQIALAALLLASAGVLGRSFERIRAVRLGFDASNTLTMWISAPNTKYRNDAEIARYYAALVEQVRAVPGVVGVATANKIPLDNDGLSVSPVWPESGPLASVNLPPLSIVGTVSDGYFDALHIPLVAGRSFARDPRSGDAFEAIVNASAAKMLFGDSTSMRVVGQRLRLRPGGRASVALYTIVGVASDIRDTSLFALPAPTVYVAMHPAAGQAGPPLSPVMAVVVRTAGDPVASIARLREAVRSLDPAVPTFKIAPLREVMNRSMVRLSFTLVTFAAGALVTLALSAIGLYGVISYIVSLRTREIGIRIALGARPLSIEVMIARQTLSLAVVGLAVGAILFFVFARVLRTLAFGVAATDLTAFATTMLALAAVSIVAGWLPARRARSLDAVAALRHE